MRKYVRLKVSAAVAMSYALAFAPLLLAGTSGLWWVHLMVPLSLPLVLVACATSFLPNRLSGIPPWSLFALISVVGLSVLVFYLTTQSWIGLVSAVVATPAAVIFYLIARNWLRPKLADI